MTERFVENEPLWQPCLWKVEYIRLDKYDYLNFRSMLMIKILYNRQSMEMKSKHTLVLIHSCKQCTVSKMETCFYV